MSLWYSAVLCYTVQSWAETGGGESEIFVLSLQNEYEKKHNLTNKPYVYEVFGNRSVVVDVGTS